MVSKYNKGDKAETMILTGKGMFVRLFQPDVHPQYGSKWTVTLLLDAAEKERAEAAQLQVKYNPSYAGKFPGYDGHFVRVTRPTKKSTYAGGGPNDPPEVIDVHQASMDPTILIGDGSDLKVKFIVKSSDAASIKKWGGKSVWLLKAQVTSLIKGVSKSSGYAPEDDFMEDSSEWGSSKSEEANTRTEASPFDKVVAS